jgi:hypothetical protein
MKVTPRPRRWPRPERFVAGFSLAIYCMDRATGDAGERQARNGPVWVVVLAGKPGENGDLAY